MDRGTRRFFGGTVNVKYLSVLFVGDDAFDTDEGYQGKGQFLFVMIGNEGNHGTEMDSKTNSDFDSMPRSHPAFYSMTIIGGGASGRSGGLMRLREGTGGKFGNVVLAHATDYGVKNDNCGAELRTPTLPSAGTSLGMAGDSASSGYLFFSPNNMISGATSTFNYGSGTSACTDAGFSAITADPGFASISSTTDLDYTTMGATFDPTAASSASSMCSAVDSAPFGDSFCKHESASTLCTSYAAVC